MDPLLGDLRRMPLKTSVFFGDCDWMYFGGKDVNLSDLNPRIRERVIKGASHNIHFDEPELLMQYIMSDLKEYLQGYTFI